MQRPVTPLRVSVAMATFDGSAWVAEQLESIARQTRPPDELVVCDDASRDDTVAVLEAFAARARFPVRISRNPGNLGPTPNFGRAVSLTTGGVVLLADQDDVWRPDKIERLAGAIEADPSVGLAFSNARVVDAALRPLGHTLWDALRFDRRERQKVRDGLATEVFARHVVAAGTSLAFRGSFRDLVLPFPDLHDCHDAWIAFLIAATSGIRLVEEELVDYRIHGANQFGLRRLSLREQLARARWEIDAEIFQHGVRFFGGVRQRLAERPHRPADPRSLALVEAKLEHCRRRDAMSPRLRERLPVILDELVSGRYARFSYGLKSAAQDLWLR